MTSEHKRLLEKCRDALERCADSLLPSRGARVWNRAEAGREAAELARRLDRILIEELPE